MRIIAPALLLLATSLVAEASHACDVNSPPAARVNRGFEAVVVVTVTAAAYNDKRRRDWHPWEAAGTLKRVVEGTAQAPRFRFGRSGSTAACDDGVGPPKPGEEWVLYLASADGEPRVEESYPLPLARRIDRRFPSKAGSGQLRVETSQTVWWTVLGALLSIAAAAVFLRWRSKPKR